MTGQKDGPGMTALVIDRRHPLRDATERMIRDTYRAHHDAELGRFPDLLAALLSPDGLPAAACSIRFAEHGFFSAIYLGTPLEQALSAATGHHVPLAEIMEIGSLAATKPGNGFALVDAAIAFGRGHGKTIGIFTATEMLRRSLARVGRPPIDLGAALPERLGRAAWAWGRYYETNPRVCALIDSPDNAIRLTRAAG